MSFEIKVVQDQMQAADHYAQLINAMNRELARHPHTIGQIGGHLAKAGGVVGGGAVGGGAVCLGIFLLLANPAGWMFAAGGLAGGVAGGGLGYFFAKRAVVNYQQQAEAVSASLKNLVKKVDAIQNLQLKTGVTPLLQINAFKDHLIRSGYLSANTDNSYTLNENKFTEIGNWYEEGVRDQVKNSAKFVILSTLASLPEARRPTDQLLDDLKKLVDELANAELKSSAQMTLGILHIAKQDPINAYRRFNLVPKDNHWYARSQSFMRMLEESFPKVRAQVAK